MITLQNKPNTNAPSPAFPYGDLRDNPGDNTGTPVNRELLSDIMQTVEKIVAESGITPNGLLDNASNGWQLFDAMKKVFYPFKEHISVHSVASSTVTTISTFQNDIPVTVTVGGLGMEIQSADLVGKALNDFDLSLEFRSVSGTPMVIGAGGVSFNSGAGLIQFGAIQGTTLATDFEFRIALKMKR